MNMTEFQKLNKWEVQQLRLSTRLRQSMKFRQLGNAVLDYLIYILCARRFHWDALVLMNV